MTFKQLAWSRLGLLCIAWLGLIVISYEYLDRPIARFAHAHLRDPFIVKIGGAMVFQSMTHIAGAVEPIALWGLAGIGVAALLGKPRAPWSRLFIAAALAAIVADVTKNELKIAFGRSWPETWMGNNLSYIHDGVYGFFPFRGGFQWSSFPSGHTSMITTPMAVLWFARPYLRWLAVLLVTLVLIGLIGLDYHFFSDCLAGMGLGAIVGGAAAVLFGLVPAPRDTQAAPTPPSGGDPA